MKRWFMDGVIAVVVIALLLVLLLGAVVLWPQLLTLLG